jgi:WhiB family transcriptional regulator, redox-sensing transcriptional regulator
MLGSVDVSVAALAPSVHQRAREASRTARGQARLQAIEAQPDDTLLFSSEAARLDGLALGNAGRIAVGSHGRRSSPLPVGRSPGVGVRLANPPPYRTPRQLHLRSAATALRNVGLFRLEDSARFQVRYRGDESSFQIRPAAIVKTRRWHPERGVSLEPHRAICRGCEVRAECPQAAFDLGQRAVAVWGGTSGRERRLARRRGLTATELFAELDRRFVLTIQWITHHRCQDAAARVLL